ncbi:MAG: molybdopterin-synthase adenylyltransferase MoeB [Verrucomicrobiaceae bacterium]|nr:molybdopterin-synthase adenylyltransferase MoeB [Verrucomicrobiaceae bacterium]
MLSDLPTLSDAEVRRYARHLNIPGFGPEAQRKLKAARVLVIGAGGLGSPVCLYLAAAGVGYLRLVDADKVELSNLQRQVLHGESDIGRAKTESAAARLQEINPHVRVEQVPDVFSASNAMSLADGCDVIIDGTDNFPTRYLSNDVAVWNRIPNVYGSILRFDGQVSVFAPHLDGPCYRCMAPIPPKPGLVPTCAEGGVLGVLPGIVGSMQALEAIKLITGLGAPLIGRLLHVDTLAMAFRTFKLKRDPDCVVCGPNPSITEPIDYDGFCGVPKHSPSMNTLNVVELKKLRDAKDEHFLIDVRQPDEWQACNLPGAVLIPLAEVPERAHEIPQDKRIIVHCKAGGRSARACTWLLENGFSDVWNVEGGMDAWLQTHGQP